MIEPAHDLAISKQAKALNISRGSVYYLPRPVPEADLAIMRRLDRLHLEFPFAGSRMLRGLHYRSLIGGSHDVDHSIRFRTPCVDRPPGCFSFDSHERVMKNGTPYIGL
jgi:hypothetical protein